MTTIVAETISDPVPEYQASLTDGVSEVIAIAPVVPSGQTGETLCVAEAEAELRRRAILIRAIRQRRGGHVLLGTRALRSDIVYNGVSE